MNILNIVYRVYRVSEATTFGSPNFADITELTMTQKDINSEGCYVQKDWNSHYLPNYTTEIKGI